MKIRLLIIALAICTIATPAMADLFGITVSNPQTRYVGTTFTADTSAAIADLLNIKQGSAVEGLSFPALSDWTEFDWYPDGIGSDTGSFSLSLAISSIDDLAFTAVGLGSFTFTDNDGDTIIGNISGDWTVLGGALHFAGLLSDVYYAGEGTFDGGAGPGITMGFSGPPLPWSGSIVELTATAPWFSAGNFDTHGGSIDMTVVPVPAAVLLGMLGLGVAGIKLRKYA